MGTDETVIDLDSSSSEVYGKQEESKYNGYFKWLNSRFVCKSPLYSLLNALE